MYVFIYHFNVGSGQWTARYVEAHRANGPGRHDFSLCVPDLGMSLDTWPARPGPKHQRAVPGPALFVPGRNGFGPGPCRVARLNIYMSFFNIVHDFCSTRYRSIFTFFLQPFLSSPHLAKLSVVEAIRRSAPYKFWIEHGFP
jgi:hypothetical protein